MNHPTKSRALRCAPPAHDSAGTPMTTGEHVDVLIVGAGLSGIGAAARLGQEHPGRSYLVLEAREASGGTWDLFRYPGIRSDSDMFTLGYRFKPWRGDRRRWPTARRSWPTSARPPASTASSAGSATGTGWSPPTGTPRPRGGRVTAETPDGDRCTLTAGFLWSLHRLLRLRRRPTSPTSPASSDFAGRVVHPQHWPEDLDHAGQAGRGDRQRRDGRDAGARRWPSRARRTSRCCSARRRTSCRCPAATRSRGSLPPAGCPTARSLPRSIRWKNIAGRDRVATSSAGGGPTCASRLIRAAGADAAAARGLRPVDAHFKPPYDPWDQRLCLVPDGDLFRAHPARRAPSVVTDTIDTLHRRRASGSRSGRGARGRPRRHGDRAQPASRSAGSRSTVDGDDGRPAGHDGLQGADARGRAQLRLHHRLHQRVVDAEGRPGRRLRLPAARPPRRSTATAAVVAGPRPGGRRGAVHGLRARATSSARCDLLPKQGDREPWRLRQNYLHDVRTIRRGPIDDGVLRFT